MYSIKFSERGFQVRTAVSGKDALEQIESKKFTSDIILLDILMPLLDGLKLLEILRKKKLCENSKKIILSNLGEEKDIAKAKELGADGFIIKAGSTPSEMVDQVKKISGA